MARTIGARAGEGILGLVTILLILGCTRAAPGGTGLASSRVVREPIVAASREEAPGSGAPGAEAFVDAMRPMLDEATRHHVRELFAAGVRAGNRSDVFAKIGDSITESQSFLSDIGHGWYELGRHTDLEPVISFFRRRELGPEPETNSFTRASRAASAGWSSVELLTGGDQCPVEQELVELRPAFALVMIGTNDAERGDRASFARRLGSIVQRIEARGVVPVLSTIPDQLSSPRHALVGRELNDVVRRLAAERHLPLVDYWRALQALPARGLSEDGVHPTVYVQGESTAPGAFTDAALRYGYNVRNLAVLRMLDRLTRSLDLLPASGNP